MISLVRNTVTVLGLTLGAAPSSEPAASLRAESPRAVLRRAGFREVHHRWLCRQELRLLRQLERLKPLEEAHHRTRRRWQALGDAQHQLRKKIEYANKAIEQLDEKIAASRADPLRRQRFADQQRKLQGDLAEHRQKLFRELEGVREQSEITEAARQHATNCTRLEASRIALKAGAAEAETWYRPIDERVQAALDALQPNHRNHPRLGPLKEYGRKIPPLLESIEKKLGSRQIPIFREGGRFHIPAVLNEMSPLTFAVDDELAISAVPTPLLVAAGVDITASAEMRDVAVGEYRISGRVTRIVDVRLGPLKLRNVPCLAIDPIGDDAGPLLAAAVFDGEGVVWDYERLELRVPAE